METKDGQTYVKDLYQLEVHSVSDVMSVLTAGYGLRRTNATNMNEVSSRCGRGREGGKNYGVAAAGWPHYPSRERLTGWLKGGVATAFRMPA